MGVPEHRLQFLSVTVDDLGCAGAEDVLEGSEDERQRRTKLVADVGEERLSRVIQVGELFALSGLLFSDFNAEQACRQSPRDEVEENGEHLVERPSRIEADDQDGLRYARAFHQDWYDDGAAYGIGPTSLLEAVGSLAEFANEDWFASL